MSVGVECQKEAVAAVGNMGLPARVQSNSLRTNGLSAWPKALSHSRSETKLARSHAEGSLMIGSAI